jgi:UDP-N-acetylbacillosamine N-acetyltransferase
MERNPVAVSNRRRMTMKPHNLVILGFGGHARSIADVALDRDISDLMFVDATARAGESFFGFPVLTEMPNPLPQGWEVFPAAGDNAARQRQIERAAAQSLPMGCLVSQHAYVGKGATIQPGSFIAHHAHLGPMAAVGRGTIINTAAIVDHDSHVGDFTHISVNTTIAGRCKIGDLVFVGAGATVIDGIRIVDRVTIGAGSTVVDDIVEPGTYVGSPARLVKKYHRHTPSP